MGVGQVEPKLDALTGLAATVCALALAAQQLPSRSASDPDVRDGRATPASPPGVRAPDLAVLRAPTSALQERVLRLMHGLAATGELLGGQACLIHNGRLLVDVAAGTMGPVDPRPVRTDSLFQLFAAGSPLLATLALQETQRGPATWRGRLQHSVSMATFSRSRSPCCGLRRPSPSSH